MEDHLRLRTVRLRPAETWGCEGPGQALVFVLPKAGQARHLLGVGGRSVGAGDVLVLSGTLGGRLTPQNEREFQFSHFSLCLEHLFPLFDSSEISCLQRVVDGFRGAKVYPAASEAARECHRLAAGVPAQFDLAHRSQLLRVAVAILGVEFQLAQQHAAGYVRMEEHLVQVFERLTTAEMLDCSVGELAAKFSCSRRHLNRLFHQYFGISVAALKMEMRLLKAVSLLRNPDAKVIRVAEECGFNHLGLFNTCFKRRFGASPGRWHRQVAQTGVEAANHVKARVNCPLRQVGLCPKTANPAAAYASARQHRAACPEAHSPTGPDTQDCPMDPPAWPRAGGAG